MRIEFGVTSHTPGAALVVFAAKDAVLSGAAQVTSRQSGMIVRGRGRVVLGPHVVLPTRGPHAPLPAQEPEHPRSPAAQLVRRTVTHCWMAFL